MYDTVLPQLWMQLPKDVKDHLIGVFNIVKTGVTEIRDQEVVRDGYTVDDLKAITHEKMNEYVGSEESFPRAWELTCMKAKYDLSPPPTPLQPTIEESVKADEQISTETNKKTDGTKKNK